MEKQVAARWIAVGVQSNKIGRFTQTILIFFNTVGLDKCAREGDQQGTRRMKVFSPYRYADPGNWTHLVNKIINFFIYLAMQIYFSKSSMSF